MMDLTPLDGTLPCAEYENYAGGFSPENDNDDPARFDDAWEKESEPAKQKKKKRKLKAEAEDPLYVRLMAKRPAADMKQNDEKKNTKGPKPKKNAKGGKAKTAHDEPPDDPPPKKAKGKKSKPTPSETSLRAQLKARLVTRRALTNKFKKAFEEGNSKKCPVKKLAAINASKSSKKEAFEEWLDNDGTQVQDEAPPAEPAPQTPLKSRMDVTLKVELDMLFGKMPDHKSCSSA